MRKKKMGEIEQELLIFKLNSSGTLLDREDRLEGANSEDT